MNHLLIALSKTLSLLAIVSFGMLTAHAQYTPLAPLPIGEAGSTPGTYTLTSYLSGMLKLLIALGGGVAILTAIIGGTQYVAAGISPDAKSNAKERIQHSLIGLALVLSSYLILNTINPKLVEFNLMLPKVGAGTSVSSGVGVVQPGVGTTVGGTTVTGGAPVVSGATDQIPIVADTGCSSCVPLSPTVPQKLPGSGCKAPGPCTVNQSIAGKLESLNLALGQKNIRWQVTEMWPPTRTHKAECQNPGPAAGTCVDASLLSQRTPANIKEFVRASSINGLRAVYEVKTEQRRLELVAGGVPSSNVSNQGSWITGEHFSVYNN